MAHKSTNINIRNKKAFFEYEIMDRFVAGIQLVGTEIKSIRSGKASIVDAYCRFNRSELYVVSMNISEYDFGNINNHEARRDRKLLLHKKELIKLEKKIKESGLSIIPLKMFITDKGFCKLEIGLGKGKRTYDKRESLKKNDAQRDIDRAMKF